MRIQRWAAVAVLVLVGCRTLKADGSPAASSTPVEVIVLGTAQDGGLPHVGCHQGPCERARRESGFRRRVVSLGIVDRLADRRFLVEATPDLSGQLDLFDQLAGGPRPRGRNPVDGVLVTHGHVGHYTGLTHFGREVASTRKLPLFATPRMLDFLRGSGPWSLLFKLDQLEGISMEPAIPKTLTERLTVSTLNVPHRDEFTDTVGFRFEGPSKKLLFIPDIDRWERWDRRIEDEVAAVDVALLDATFFSEAELPGRSMAEIPHPLVRDTLARLKSLAASKRIILIHLNHSNPLVDANSAQSQEVREAGFEVATEGMRIAL